ncbi:MAG: hypothetical protein KAU31_16525 [Spirochaetaceae bacterium]|nr:hypothetical protein [Spirochaetaceae bacterium]
MGTGRGFGKTILIGDQFVLGEIPAVPAALKGFLEEQERDDPKLFTSRVDTIRGQVEGLKTALSAGDYDETGRVMNENHRILVDMGISHDRLVYLCDLANSLGATGAKVTGAGRGGYMVALTPSKELQDKVASAFEAEGIAVIRATIGGESTDDTQFQILE